MKKAFLKAGIIILVIAILMSIFVSGALVYTSNKIDYSIDEELFLRSKESLATYYYAFDEFNNLEEVWNSSSSKNKDWVEIEYAGDNVKKAFISMEDREFYNHKGINWGRTAKAAANYIFKFQPKFGASTITQQVIKNISGDNENSISRKTDEIFRAVKLEKKHSKDDILEVYLNIVPMSGNMYGIGMAADRYFGKEPYELSIAEAATLAGITNAPARYNPYEYPDACIEKRNKVLYAMYTTNAITEEEYIKACSEKLAVVDNNGKKQASSWFIETAREDIILELMAKQNISRAAASILLNGAKVVLTMNKKIQSVLDEYFSNTENLSSNVGNGLKYSMVVTDPHDGNLLGIIGNGGTKNGEMLYNYATSPVIPGSVLKPIALYAPLIESNKISWSTLFDDAPNKYIGENGVGYPKNSPDIYEGTVDTDYALKKSKNTVAVELYNTLGARNIYELLKDTFGIETIYDELITADGRKLTDIAESPLALGQLSVGVSLRKLTECYNVFPNEGTLVSGKSYYYVIDRNGSTILDNIPRSKQVFSKATSQIMNQLLCDVVTGGTASRISLKEYVDTAGKTGTSGGDKDRLFIGYTPYFTAGIWCGYSDGKSAVGYNKPSHLDIWNDVMTEIHNEILSDYKETGEGFNTSELYYLPYCSKSGNMPNENCYESEDCEVRYGYFKKSEYSKEECNFH